MSPFLTIFDFSISRWFFMFITRYNSISSRIYSFLENEIYWIVRRINKCFRKTMSKLPFIQLAQSQKNTFCSDGSKPKLALLWKARELCFWEGSIGFRKAEAWAWLKLDFLLIFLGLKTSLTFCICLWPFLFPSIVVHTSDQLCF